MTAGRRADAGDAAATARSALQRATLPRRTGPAAQLRPAAKESTRAASAISRTPFILLLLALLGGGLICLLVVNTTLAAASFRISDLQKGNVQLAQQAQNLQQQVSTEEAPATIEQHAYKLGLRPQKTLHYIDVQTGRRYISPAGEAGATAVPGYGP